MADHYIGAPERRRSSMLFLLLLVIIILFFSRYIAATVIDYSWWSEVGQLDTWFNQLLYGTVPVAVAVVLLWVLFFAAFIMGSKGRRFAVLSPSLVKGIAAVGTFVLALIVGSIVVDNWTVVRFFGGAHVGEHGTYADPIFGKPLTFYFFALPFYKMALGLVIAAALVSLVIYGLSANLHNLQDKIASLQSGAFRFETEDRPRFDLPSTTFIRIAAAVLLLGFAGRLFFSRYDFLFTDHGPFLVGVNWTADHVEIPLQWLMIAGAFVAAVLVLVRRAKLALLLLLILPIRYIVPAVVGGLYVRPNELALEKPYIQHHINATRDAYGLNGNVKETTLEAAAETPIDYEKHKPVLDNVRLWDWRAFHDTISQIQPLRPYVYVDTDIDRYTIDGQLRQVLLSARELDITQLGTATNWINTRLMYTHGYGLVMAEANRITPDGLPYLFIKDAPPVVTTPSLKLTQPELYFEEQAHEPIFVDTAQQEFDYPSGSKTEYTAYKGSGGFPISNIGMRLAAAIAYGEPNILLTSYLTGQSRMLIHTAVVDRVNKLAGFISWDSDPYIVVRNNGRLTWMVDGYMTSDAHPYSRSQDSDTGSWNYIRNSVKATVDAYTGETHLYVFDESDILVQAYRSLFPQLFLPWKDIPADMRAHARYPETLFNAQAAIYRAFHMRDPEAFYNRADLWDLAKTSVGGAGEGPSYVSPTYVVAALPGENTSEFMLITPFTPANKDNLIGYMAARCDGTHLGQVVFEQLSKQTIIYGPMQIDARINQDQTISKDLTLWNQQGSRVLRGQTLVLPIDNSFLYVQPIYIQSSQASMPQLKKVALAMGNKLAYADTYEQALTQLIDELGGTQEQPQAPVQGQPQNTPPPSNDAITKLQQIHEHLQRYRELSSQGKWADAGKELEAIQNLANPSQH